MHRSQRLEFQAKSHHDASLIRFEQPVVRKQLEEIAREFSESFDLLGLATSTIKYKQESSTTTNPKETPMASHGTKKSTVPTTTKLDSSLEEEIRCRAYQLYEERGREDGHDLDDWLNAEAEITGTRVNVAAA